MRGRLPASRMATDFVMAALAVLVAYWARYHLKIPAYITGGEVPEVRHYLAAAPAVAACVVIVFGFMGVYRRRRGLQFIDEAFSVIGAMTVAALVVLALMGLYREPTFSYSRPTFLWWALIAALLILAARYALRRLERRRPSGRGTDRALVVGSGVAADLVISRIRMFPDYGYQLAGVLSDGLPNGTLFGGAQVVGQVDDLSRVVRSQRADVVFLALPDASQEHLLHLIETCRGSGADFRIVPSMLELMTTQVTADHLDGIPLLQFRHGLDIGGAKVFFKRVFDIAAAGAGLVLLSPVLLAVAIAVRVSSPGPVVLVQERVGLEGRNFRMYKFRTMNEGAEQDSGPVWAAADDPRRTPVGRFLRRFSVDELPQLWNVIRGDMSLVGPRPERPVFATEFAERLPRYDDRHLVRPGITGWAQMNDLRGQTSVDERLIYDLYYIENWSLAFDIKIILITLFRVFTHKNAY